MDKKNLLAGDKIALGFDFSLLATHAGMVAQINNERKRKEGEESQLSMRTTGERNQNKRHTRIDGRC